ncbi:hypothetical protein MASR2M17_17180 [Aminivibrio sp.]
MPWVAICNAVDYDNAKVTRVDKDNAYTASGNVFRILEVEAGILPTEKNRMNRDYLYILFSEEDKGWPAQYNNGKVVLDADWRSLRECRENAFYQGSFGHGGDVEAN